LPDNELGGNIGPLQSDVLPLQSGLNHGDGSSSELIARGASRHPTLSPALEPETTDFVIEQVADPPIFARTPSPLSSFGSSLHIGPQACSVPHYGQVARLTETQLAIISSLCQLQGDTLYGVWMTDVFQSVTEMIETTEEEFM